MVKVQIFAHLGRMDLNQLIYILTLLFSCHNTSALN